MANLTGIIRQLPEEPDRAVNEVKRLATELAAFGAAYSRQAGTPNSQAAARSRMAAAQRARWAKGKAQKKWAYEDPPRLEMLEQLDTNSKTGG
jgi:hypothetical protein